MSFMTMTWQDLINVYVSGAMKDVISPVTGMHVWPIVEVGDKIIEYYPQRHITYMKTIGCPGSRVRVHAKDGNR